MRNGLIALVCLLALLAAPAFALDAQRITEIKANGSESLFDFLLRFPKSFEAQVFYGLVMSGMAGAVASWLWKWSQGTADGFAHFTPRYTLGQVLWLIGSSLFAVATVGFTTDDGQFFGWLTVLWGGAMAGFSGEVKVKGSPQA